MGAVFPSAGTECMLQGSHEYDMHEYCYGIHNTVLNLTTETRHEQLSFL